MSDDDLDRYIDSVPSELLGRPLYYDRAGQPMTFRQWGEARYENDDRRAANIRVASTLVGAVWVSTVWLGIDHGFGNGPPLIFETMTFAADDAPHDAELWARYSTEADAHAGHALAVAELAIELGVEPIEETEFS